MTRKGRRARRLGVLSLARRSLALALVALILALLVTWIVALAYRAPMASADGQPTPVGALEYHGPGCAYWHHAVRVGETWGLQAMGLISPMLE